MTCCGLVLGQYLTRELPDQFFSAGVSDCFSAAPAFPPSRASVSTSTLQKGSIANLRCERLSRPIALFVLFPPPRPIHLHSVFV